MGWWEGELNGKRGVFPDNFVKLLPSDFEKEVSIMFFQFHCRMQNETRAETVFQIDDLDKVYLSVSKK